MHPRSRDSDRSCGPYARQCFQELTFGSCAFRGLGENGSEPAPKQRIARRLSGKLNGEWNEPRRLTRTRARARDRGVLLEERQQERALRGKVPVDRTLREPGGEGDFIECRDFKAPLGEQLEPGGDEKRPRLRFASLMNDSHEYPRYLSGPVAQVPEPAKARSAIPASIGDSEGSLD